MVQRSKSLNDIRPVPCDSCVFCCPWNGQGWGCAHKSVKGLLRGTVACGGQHYKKAGAFVWPPKVTEVVPEDGAARTEAGP